MAALLAAPGRRCRRRSRATQPPALGTGRAALRSRRHVAHPPAPQRRGRPASRASPASPRRPRSCPSDTYVIDGRISGDRRGFRYAVEGAYELGRVASYGVEPRQSARSPSRRARASRRRSRGTSPSAPRAPTRPATTAIPRRPEALRSDPARRAQHPRPDGPLRVVERPHGGRRDARGKPARRGPDARPATLRQPRRPNGPLDDGGADPRRRRAEQHLERCSATRLTTPLRFTPWKPHRFRGRLRPLPLRRRRPRDPREAGRAARWQHWAYPADHDPRPVEALKGLK